LKLNIFTFTSMKLTAIILAGGKSKRMGANKALIPYRGKALIQYSIDLARCFTNDIIISANTGELAHLGYRIVPDLLPIPAPLTGIHAALLSSKTSWNLVLTCDMPNVTRDLIDQMIPLLTDSIRIVIPFHNGYTEPLCGFYHASLTAEIERNFSLEKYSPLDLIAKTPHHYLAIETLPGVSSMDFLFKNVNKKQDLDR